MTTAPKSATKVPADTSVFVPVLPEAVPMFAQVSFKACKAGEIELEPEGARRGGCTSAGDRRYPEGSNQPGLLI